jgi:hypothetical protein
VFRSLDYDCHQKWCGMLVARALKNSQLTCGERHAISGTGH